jgi:hypothetical protein
VKVEKVRALLGSHDCEQRIALASRSQSGELFALGGTQDVLAASGLACVGRGARDPRGDALRADAELTRQLGRRASGHGQLHDLLLECLRVRRLALGHLGLLPWSR